MSIVELEAELDHLVADYEDSDRQDEDLRRAIKRQRDLIRKVKQRTELLEGLT